MNLTRDDKYHYWSGQTFEIISVSMTDKFSAVYIYEDGVRANDIHAIAVARVTRTSYRILNEYFGKRSGDAIGEVTEIDVVGLELVDGSFEVTAECSNFCGLIERGSSPFEATAYLQAERFGDFDKFKKIFDANKRVSAKGEQ